MSETADKIRAYEHAAKVLRAGGIDAQVVLFDDIPAGEHRTDGPGRIAKDATPLLRDLLDEWQKLSDYLWRDPNAPKSGDRMRTALITRQVDLFGTVYLLAALRDLDPVKADRAAAFLAETWDAGDSLGEWVYQWGKELEQGRPLTVFLNEEATA